LEFVLQSYTKRAIYTRKTDRKLSFLQKKITQKKKKFSEIFYNLLIFSIGFQTIEEKVFRNEIQTARKDRNSAHYRTAMI